MTFSGTQTTPKTQDEPFCCSIMALFNITVLQVIKKKENNLKEQATVNSKKCSCDTDAMLKYQT